MMRVFGYSLLACELVFVIWFMSPYGKGWRELFCKAYGEIVHEFAESVRKRNESRNR
jgi:hypothetical protein